MTNYIKTLRLPIVVLAGLLCLVSFKLSQAQYSAFLPTVFTIFLTGTCMTQNDWRDRKHDVLKRKCFAIKNEFHFLIFLLILWSITIALTVMILKEHIEFGWIAMAGIFSSLIYSETRKIPLIPTLLVALTSASSTLFPAMLSHSPVIFLLFLSVALLIFGREILKDLDDINHDGGYKWTIPLSIGAKQAKIIAGIFILSSAVASIVLSPKTIPGVILLIISSVYLLTNRSHKTAKTFIDFGVLLILISLLILDT